MTMAVINFLNIVIVLVLIQLTLSKPLDDNSSNSFDSSEEKHLTPQQALKTYASASILLLATSYARDCIKFAQQLLKDEKLLTHQNPEVMEFKNNITKFVENYENLKDVDKFVDVVDNFSNSVYYYLEISKEKVTPASRFILELINKYNFKDMENDMVKEYGAFLEHFTEMFEKVKEDLEKALVEWFEKFTALKTNEEKIDAINEFLDKF